MPEKNKREMEVLAFGSLLYNESGVKGNRIGVSSNRVRELEGEEDLDQDCETLNLCLVDVQAS